MMIIVSVFSGILLVFKFIQLVNGAYTLGVAYTYVGRCMLDMNFGAGEVPPIAT